MKKQYFGTDGIRGTVGTPPITPDFMLKLGWACGRVFRRHAPATGRCSIIIGKDTRVSGYMFESSLEAGLVAAGVDVKLLGPMPTPAVALMTRTQNADAGIVISASHNAFEDNGIKFFSAGGAKLADAIELEIEAELALTLETVAPEAIGKVVRVVDAAGRYIEFCKSTVPEGFSLRGLRIALDCAHGATYAIAPSVFSELGAEVIPMGVAPDGFNINAGVGSTHMEALCALVRERGADLGIAFDGDGDRVLFVDEGGAVVDGDQLLYVIAMHRLAGGSLDAGVVGTLMSNLGLELALRDAGLAFVRAPVGDRYVRERMETEGWHLGGEASGHIICSDVTTTGDGIVSALQVLLALRAAARPLSVLTAGMRKLPQALINVRAGGQASLSGNAALDRAVAATEKELGEGGRVLLRASGTEPVVRVMVEGQETAQVEAVCRRLADEVSRSLA